MGDDCCVGGYFFVCGEDVFGCDYFVDVVGCCFLVDENHIFIGVVFDCGIGVEDYVFVGCFR